MTCCWLSRCPGSHKPGCSIGILADDELNLQVVSGQRACHEVDLKVSQSFKVNRFTVRPPALSGLEAAANNAGEVL
jgi:hypothetical protein